jgi:hypothetical protein
MHVASVVSDQRKLCIVCIHPAKPQGSAASPPRAMAIQGRFYAYIQLGPRGVVAGAGLSHTI